MKILITGNMGYVGPAVTKQLRASFPDAVLIGFDIGYFARSITNTNMLPECKINIQHFGDMRQFPQDILQGVDAIVHLAAISNDPIGNKFEDVTQDINYRASIDLAKKAKEAGVTSFVFASSCSMYGSADDSARTETSLLNPLTAYARSKVLTETDLSPLASETFKISCLRFSTACGWSDRLRLDLVLNDFVAGAVASKKITILSDGMPWRPLINIKDMARAIDWAISRESANGGNFLAVNVGSDEWNYQVKDLAQEVANVIAGTEISINKDAQPDNRSYRVNFDLFKVLAPFHQPKVSLTESIKELYDGLISVGFKDGEFRNSQYMRLNILAELQEKALVNDKLQWI
ncbi:NAD-dependent epimerase/dehydratase family protein [Crenothrix sp.]|uniref:NAD-dependent epimerase/dehydratase family protein n=1 Tax=Crenothrix sp. TaxID=3100433 RepID=UPI00374DB667